MICETIFRSFGFFRFPKVNEAEIFENVALRHLTILLKQLAEGIVGITIGEIA